MARFTPASFVERTDGLAFDPGLSPGPIRVSRSIQGSEMPGGSITFVRSRWLFLRLLAVVYFIAFLSLAVQITGLVGEQGILPAGEFLRRAHEVYGSQAYRLWPTLVWFSQRDAFLSILCWGGALTSLALIAGLAPAVTTVLLWFLYLSLTIAGQVFLQFQWDALLLETGLLAILYAPLAFRSRFSLDPEPPALVRWVLWGLAFKLTFLSGITKIVSGDPAWAQWTALRFHYETQPIPAWTSWFIHQFPPWFHYWSAVAMFAIELGVPWLIFAPARFRRLRLVACCLMIALQAGIAATGNYGFFNLLTIVLYLALLDDQTLEAFLPGRISRVEPRGEGKTASTWRMSVSIAVAGIAVLSLLALVREIEATRGQRGFVAGGWAEGILDWFSPFNSINGYGLFRVMTTERPEIVIEVSEDGNAWKEYEFRWKAGDVMRRPRFVQPHMPRLDWQMWFAALDARSAQGWLEQLIARLLEGDTAVVKLLGPSPLPGPPRYVRLAYYQYHFTSSAERARTGAWWKREFLGYLTEPIGPRPR
jgi:lipase maturation factor 1